MERARTTLNQYLKPSAHVFRMVLGTGRVSEFVTAMHRDHAAGEFAYFEAAQSRRAMCQYDGFATISQKIAIVARNAGQPRANHRRMQR